MSRREQRRQRIQQEKEFSDEEGAWARLCRRIDDDQVIPIVSNAFFIDRLFDLDSDQILDLNQGVDLPGDWSIEEQLADIWAEEIQFPLGERHRLAHVALYKHVLVGHNDAKVEYLDFLKDLFLDVVEDDPDVDPEQIEEMREELGKYKFSDIVANLGHPKPFKGRRDPLRLLAQLPLSIYVTTSPFDFLERAIRAAGREPRTQVCFWSGEPGSYKEPGHETDYNFKPTPQTPLVYHVFGLEDYHQSIIVSEDDYMEFLIQISQDTNQKKPLLPLYLQRALAQSSLILMGYRLRDWDFRIIFRGLIKPSDLRDFSLSIQLDPDQQGLAASSAQVRDYLVKYFDSSKFTVEWGSSYGFIERLWEAWDRQRR
jgi:hypothetical protein